MAEVAEEPDGVEEPELDQDLENLGGGVQEGEEEEEEEEEVFIAPEESSILAFGASLRRRRRSASSASRLSYRERQNVAKRFVDGAEEEDEDEAFEGDTKEITQLKEAIRDVKKLQKNELEQETLSQEEVEDGEVRTRNVEYGEARMRNINRQDLMDNHAEIVAVSEGQGNQSELDLGLTLKRLNEILEIRKKLAEDRKKLAEDNINSYTDDEYSGMDYEDSDTDDKDSDTDENQKKALNAIKKGWGEDGYSDREEEYSDRDDANGLITDKRLTNEPLSEEQRWELRLLIRYKPKIKKMQRFFYQNIWINEEGKLRKKKPGTNSGSLKTVDSDGKDGLLRPRLKEYLYKISTSNLLYRSRDERTGKTPCCRWVRWVRWGGVFFCRRWVRWGGVFFCRRWVRWGGVFFCRRWVRWVRWARW